MREWALRRSLSSRGPTPGANSRARVITLFAAGMANLASMFKSDFCLKGTSSSSCLTQLSLGFAFAKPLRHEGDVQSAVRRQWAGIGTRMENLCNWECGEYSPGLDVGSSQSKTAAASSNIQARLSQTHRSRAKPAVS